MAESRGAVDVRREVLINRPRALVAAYMFDPKNDADWTRNVRAVRPLVEGRLRVGSRVERRVRFLGREFGYMYEVVAADGDHFVEMVVQQPFPMQIRYQLDDVVGGTRATIHARGNAGRFFRWAGPLMRAMVARSIGNDLRALKAHIESRP